MSELANIQAVQQIYADFMQGNIPAILSRLNPDVAWTNAGPDSVPYARKRRGAEAVQEFFTTLGANVEVQAFEPIEYFANGERVVVLGSWSGKAKTTGRPFASDWTMAWTIRDGQILSFRSYEDTHAIAAAFTA